MTRNTENLVFIAANKQTTSFSGRPVLLPDCTVSINHKFSNSVTEHPIELGSSVVDHVVNKNLVMNISGIFNQHSLMQYSQSVLNPESKVQEAYDYLVSLRNNRTPFVVVSKYDVYNDCIIRELEIPVAPTDGKSTLIFNMEIVQIRFARSEQVTLVQVQDVSTPFKDSAAAKQSTGNKAPEIPRVEVIDQDGWIRHTVSLAGSNPSDIPRGG
jgi:hypothetical protein